MVYAAPSQTAMGVVRGGSGEHIKEAVESSREHINISNDGEADDSRERV